MISAKYNRYATAFIASSLISGSLSATVLEEVIVTAHKHEQSLFDMAASLDVVSGEELKRANVTDMRSLTSLSPSLSFTDNFAPSASAFSMRGITSYSFEGGVQPSVVLIVDDVPYSRAGEFVTNLYNIEQVEILRGPQGSHIGKNATAGAVIVTTQRPSEEFEAEVSIDLSDDDGQFYRAWVSGPLTENVRGLVSGFYSELDDYIRNINTTGMGQDGYGGFDNKGLAAKLEINFSDDISLLLSGDYRDYEGRIGTPEVILPFSSDPAGHIALLGYTPRKNHPVHNSDAPGLNTTESSGVSAQLTWNINDNLVAKSITAARSYDEDAENDLDQSNGAVFGGFLQWFPVGQPRRPFETETFSQELRLNGNFEKFNFVTGLYYSDYQEDIITFTPFRKNVSLFGAPNDILEATDTIESALDDETLSFYLDGTYDVTDQLSVFAGLRYTDETIEFDLVNVNVQIPFIVGVTTAADFQADKNATLAAGSNLTLCSAPGAPTSCLNRAFSGKTTEKKTTGRIGLSYQVDESVNLYGSFSTGFKGPGIDLSRSSTSAQSAILSPEESRAIELGFKSKLLDNKLTINGAWFLQKTDDLQLSQLIPGSVLTQLVNAGEAESRGFEIDFAVAASEALTLSGGIVYIDSELRDITTECYPGQLFNTGCNTGTGTPGTDSTNPDAATGYTHEDLTGTRIPSTPELKFNLAANYDWHLDNQPFDLYGRVGYVWQDDVRMRLGTDPLIVQDAYGLIDLTLGLVDKEGNYEVTLYGKNIGDEYHYNNIGQVDGFLGRAIGYSGRSAHSYWGITGRLRF